MPPIECGRGAPWRLTAECCEKDRAAPAPPYGNEAQVRSTPSPLADEMPLHPLGDFEDLPQTMLERVERVEQDLEKASSRLCCRIPLHSGKKVASPVRSVAIPPSVFNGLAQTV